MSHEPVAPTAGTPPAGPTSLGLVPRGEPLAFHRLGRVPGGRRWIAVLVVVLGVVVYLGLGVVGIAVLAVVDALAGTRWGERAVSFDFADPVAFVAAYASIAAMLPVVLLVRHLIGPRPVGLLASVAGGLRWRWLARALLVSAVVHVLSFAAQIGVDVASGVSFEAPRFVPGAWVFLLGAVLLVPVQSAAEEFVFRGVLMQTIGSWLRHPAFAVLVPVPLFVFGHDYDLWGQLDIAAFAVVTGWITWRTGGLEAAIALHVLNNSLITVLTAIALADPNADTGSPAGLAASVLTLMVASALLVRSADRGGVQRHRPAGAGVHPGRLVGRPSRRRRTPAVRR